MNLMKVLVLLFCCQFFCSWATLAQYDEFVEEVVAEDYRNDDEYENPYMTDEDEARIRQKEKERKEQKLAEEERRAQEEAERIRQQREALYEAELSKMSEAKKKATKKQKKKDAKIVKQVLRAASKENHYGVLGLRFIEFEVAPRSFSIGPKQISLPGFKLFHISGNQIRRAYRKRATAVHPDKNRDFRANEAFIEVEASASILSDPRLREQYDKSIQQARLKLKKDLLKKLRGALNVISSGFGKAFKIFKSVLGPFALPVLILGALLI